jgi:hypothetical protein
VKNCGEAVELDLFPEDPYGGSIPTSPLQFKIIQISKPQAAEIYQRFHYLGAKDFFHQFSFGASFEGVLWGALTFAVPNPHSIDGLYKKHDQKGILEINRLAFQPKSPKNSCSRMISICIKLLKQRFPLRLLISYADTSQSHTGAIYKATGFRCHGLTDKKKDFIDSNGKMVRKIKTGKFSDLSGHYVDRSQKYLFSKFF